MRGLNYLRNIPLEAFSDLDVLIMCYNTNLEPEIIVIETFTVDFQTISHIENIRVSKEEFNSIVRELDSVANLVVIKTGKNYKPV